MFFMILFFMSNSKLAKVLFEILVTPADELCTRYCTQRAILDKVHRLFVTLSCFRPDRFVQLLSLISILILLSYLLISIDLVYTDIGELVLVVYPEGEQL